MNTDSIYGSYPLECIEMPNVKVLELKRHELIISEQGIEYHMSRKVNDCDDKDGDGEWTVQYQNWRIAIARRNIAAVNLFFVSDRKYWSLQIEITGAEQGISIYYDKIADARPLYDILKNYHFGG